MVALTFIADGSSRCRRGQIVLLPTPLLGMASHQRRAGMSAV